MIQIKFTSTYPNIKKHFNLQLEDDALYQHGKRNEQVLYGKAKREFNKRAPDLFKQLNGAYTFTWELK